MLFAEGGNRSSDATQWAARLGTGHASRRVPRGVWCVVGVQDKEIHTAAVKRRLFCAFLFLAMATNKSITKMPTEYYLGIATPFLALLIGFGVSAFPRAIPFLALLIAGAFSATPITHTTDYRKIPAEMRSKCSQCPVVVGVGYMGAITACVLYEAKDMRVVLLDANDTREPSGLAYRRSAEHFPGSGQRAGRGAHRTFGPPAERRDALIADGIDHVVVAGTGAPKTGETSSLAVDFEPMTTQFRHNLIGGFRIVFDHEHSRHVGKGPVPVQTTRDTSVTFRQLMVT